MKPTSIRVHMVVALLTATVAAACGGSANDRNRRHSHSERAPTLTNVFPSDRGPVPRVRDAGATQARSFPLALDDSDPTAVAAPLPDATQDTLVLYDDSGPYAWLGELYAIAATNLASRFGQWTAKAVSAYAPGDVAAHRATIYIGSTYDQPLPAAFLDEVATGQRPVVWMYNNIWRLAAHVPDFATRYGFVPWRYDTSAIAQVTYKGRALTRYQDSGSGIMEHSPFDPTRATVLASAVRADGTTLPWAVRANNLTYVGEIPFAYIAGEDRYLAFCDLLFDVLAPATPERHRALVRIEDVSPDTDPQAMQAIGDMLFAEGIPFSIAVIATFADPHGVYRDGVPATERLGDAPDLLAVLRGLADRGATLIMHGYTHQFEDLPNPYTGASADDFEFFRAHVDAADNVIYDGPVPNDSAAWATGRIDAAFNEFAAHDLPTPTIFEYPHYAGSAVDSRALATRFATVYHRGLYFGGSLRGGPDDPARMMGQFFPYPVTDVFGWRVIPENLGNYEAEAYNNHPARLVPDLLRTAEANLVVRDGVASVFFHPFYDVAVLRTLVQGIRALGYDFVAPADLINDIPAAIAAPPAAE